ncbi:flagellar biosynthetic protein FliO [Rhizobium sp. Leaf341]|uniref:flagellar biosynthetic protein FliO n=1 Tax=Rhizobium sp. Leaf341 TaxID=1736344 RepID=UPI000715C323|nr:flagellar biosynthetic protein FliO [Rhizobium sp. Leaf341]KQR68766.1 hypothetical protein ASG03_05765 [Rhizobium sp. Leaf341]
MFEDVVGNNGGRFIIAAVAVAAGLLLLVAVLWFMRNRASSPFIRGGKNRQPRLAVLDAAAVDTRRRLVLVRRDDVEHLIMIGGPTDIVIESRIVGANPGLEPMNAGNAAITAAPSAARIAPQAAPANLARPPRADALPAPAARIAQERPAETRAEPRPPARPDARNEARPEARPDARQDARLETRQDTRPVARPSSPAAPSPAVAATGVSNMGQALYGEEASAPRTAPDPRAVVSPSTTPRAAAPAPRAAPEDILEAARARVLPQIAAAPAAVAPSHATSPVLSSPPATAAKGGPAAAEAGRRDEARDFERLLDAQISGDLGRLAADPAPRAPSIEAPRAAPRKEPTLEEEMNRMLSEMGNDRKA